MSKVLIIGTVWVETTSAAGSRMLQLIEQFTNYGYHITFTSSAQKTEKSLQLSNIDEVSIELNSSSFDEFIRELQPNIVVFDRFMTEEQFGWRVVENCPNALRILDTEDLHSLRKTRHQQLKKGLSFSTDDLLTSDITKREIASILRCDLILIISSFEMELLKNLFKIDERLLLHLPFLLEKVNDDVILKQVQYDEREHFIFVGNFLHAPNVDAVLEIKKLWKDIRKQLPKAQVHIYGAYATQQINQLHNEKDGFLIKGFAENIQEKVQKAKVVLAPIRFGAGIKGKLTEAMICGTPSVTTTIGAEGMHNNSPWNGFVCELVEFVEKSVVLYTNKDLWETSQQNGVEIINQFYDKEVLGKIFIQRIKKIQENLDEHRKQNFLGSLLQHQTLNATKYMSKWIEEKNK